MQKGFVSQEDVHAASAGQVAFLSELHAGTLEFIGVLRAPRLVWAEMWPDRPVSQWSIRKVRWASPPLTFSCYFYLCFIYFS